jgi:hypothetical protein
MKKRMKRILISPEVFLKILSQDTSWKVLHGVPITAILKGCVIDPYTNMINLFIEDGSFPEIDLGTVAPVLETEFLRLK